MLEWVRQHLDQLAPFGWATGLGTPAVWAVATNAPDGSALPWSLVAGLVILIATGGLVTLPQHKRELRQATEPFDRLYPLVERLAENDSIIIKALEDIKGASVHHSTVDRTRRQGGR